MVWGVSTHSRPKAAALHRAACQDAIDVSTHSRPKAADATHKLICHDVLFQHTAARRRLQPMMVEIAPPPPVSTHSRPKAAGQLFVQGC